MVQEPHLELHYDLLIRPEPGADFMVSLWAVRGIGISQPVLAAPRASWLTYSRLLAQVRILDSRGLGQVDALLSRGEPVLQPIFCTPESLFRIGLREELEVYRKGLALRALFRSEHHGLATNTSAEEHEADLHPRFRRIHATGAESLATDPCSVLQHNQDAEESAGSLATPEDLQSIRELSKPLPRSSFALLGVRVENLTMQETLDALDALIVSGGFHQIATANVDFLTRAFDDRELLHILHHCELVLPDGMPLVWAAKMMGVPLKGRVTGADMLPRIFALSEQKQRRIFLLGATEEHAELAMERIRREFPKAQICGRMSPPFAPIEQMDNEAILRRIATTRPDILLVAFGNPKQEKWLHRHRKLLNVPVCIGVGASIDFFSGRQSRAPKWMQEAGLEWIHRLVSEPRRLAKRYLSDGIFISRYLSVQLLALALQRRNDHQNAITLKQLEGTPVLCVVGEFTMETAAEPVRKLTDAVLTRSMVIDFTETSCISGSATGLLLRLAQHCSVHGVELWIAGLRGSLRSTLRATFPAGEPFHTAHTLRDALRFVR